MLASLRLVRLAALLIFLNAAILVAIITILLGAPGIYLAMKELGFLT